MPPPDGQREGAGSIEFVEVPVFARRRPRQATLRLSPSSIALFEQCPQLYRFIYIDKVGDQYRKPRPYFTMANHVHDTLRDFLSRVPLDMRTVETIEKLLRANWRRYHVGFRSEEDEKRWSEKALAQVRGFVSGQDISVTPHMVEASLETEITDGLILRCRVDRVDREGDGSLHVIDYKTGKVPQEHDWTQLNLYALALSRRSPYPVRRVSYLYLDAGLLESADIGERELENAEWELLAVARRVLREKRFRPRVGPWCRGCDFTPICPKAGSAEAVPELNGQLELWRDFWAEA